MQRIGTVYLIAGGAVLAALAYVALSGQAGAVGRQLAGGAVDLATGVLSGTVEGIGGAVGIPKTEPTACERAKAEGRTWDASFDCPAGDFLKYLFN